MHPQLSWGQDCRQGLDLTDQLSWASSLMTADRELVSLQNGVNQFLTVNLSVYMYFLFVLFLWRALTNTQSLPNTF